MEQEYAKAILPIRRNGNLLLCTLLVGNTTTNAFLSIFLADLTSGAVGLFASTALIVILGEITPQSICTRHGLYVGAKTIVLTRFFMAVFFPVTWPVAKALDWALGQEVGTMYNKQELKARVHGSLCVCLVPTCRADNSRRPFLPWSPAPDRAAHRAPRGDARVGPDAGRAQPPDGGPGVRAQEGRRRDDHDRQRVYGGGQHQAGLRHHAGHLQVRVHAHPGVRGAPAEHRRHPLRQGEAGRLRCATGAAMLGGVSPRAPLSSSQDLILVDPDDEMEVRTIISFNGRTHLRFVIDTTPLNEAMSLFQVRCWGGCEAGDDAGCEG